MITMENQVFHAVRYYAGRVQGVGFRYSTLQIARGFEVSGYVQNLPDGRVLLEAEGDEPEVQAFCEEVEDQLSSFIRETEPRSARRRRQFSGFVIA